MKRKMYQELAILVGAIHNCEDSGNEEWLDKHTERLEELVENHLPRGGGYNSGTSLDIENSTDKKLVFNTSYHHMDEMGGYTRWTEWEVEVAASLVSEIDVVTMTEDDCREASDIEEMLGDDFRWSLIQEIEIKVNYEN